MGGGTIAASQVGAFTPCVVSGRAGRFWGRSDRFDRNAPHRYDDLELGNCSKFEFRKALNELWKAKGLPILPSEVEGWASMFDKKRNGADSA